MEFLAIIGGMVVLWWVAGVAMFAFFVKIYVNPGAPLSAKLLTVGISGFILPWILMTTGRLPKGGIIAPIDPTQEEEEAIRAFLKNNCPCEDCRRERGEA